MSSEDVEPIENVLLLIAEIMEVAQRKEQAIRVDAYHKVLKKAALEIKYLRVQLLEAKATVSTQQATMRNYND